MRSTLPFPARAETRWSGAAQTALASLRLGFAQAYAAPPIMLGRCLFYVLIMIVWSSLWDKVAAERLPGTLAETLPAGGLAVYVGVTEWITLSIVAVQLRLEDDIRSGALEPHLLRPKSYLVQRTFEAFGGMLARLVALGATGFLMLAVSGREGPALSAYPAILVLGVLGGVIGVLLYVIVGLCAFWMRRTLPALLIMQKAMFMLGGLFAPITLYPDWLERFAAMTPFAAHIYFAGAQALAPSGAAFVEAVALQVFWIGGVTLICAAMWRAGVTRLLREGG